MLNRANRYYWWIRAVLFVVESKINYQNVISGRFLQGELRKAENLLEIFVQLIPSFMHINIMNLTWALLQQ